MMLKGRSNLRPNCPQVILRLPSSEQFLANLDNEIDKQQLKHYHLALYKLIDA